MSRYKHIIILIYIVSVSSLLIFLFKNWGYDDPFITYRYSRNLASGLGFVYNINQKTLSTTTPLFTIILAIVSIIWDNIPRVALFIGCISISVTGWLFYEISTLWKTPWVGYAGLLLYPTFPLVASTLSSETPLYIMLALFSVYFYLKKNFIITGMVSSGLVLTRPDGLIIPTVIFLHYLVNKRKLTRKALSGILIFIFITCLWFTFAWIYFGEPLPVTLSVKQSQGNMAISQKFAEGLITIVKPYIRFPYVMTFAISLIGLFYIITVPKEGPWLFLSWVFLYFLGYTVLGVSRYFWYYAPLVTAFIVLVGLGFERLCSISRILRLLMFTILIMSFTFQVKDIWILHSRPDNRLLIYQEVGKWINNNTELDSTIGLLEVGIIGFYANRTMIDFAGLIKPDVSKTFKPNSTYEDAALWTIENYNPSYVILQDGLFPNVENKLMNLCVKETVFLGKKYNYPFDMSIFRCIPF